MVITFLEDWTTETAYLSLHATPSHYRVLKSELYFMTDCRRAFHFASRNVGYGKYGNPLSSILDMRMCMCVRDLRAKILRVLNISKITSSIKSIWPTFADCESYAQYRYVVVRKNISTIYFEIRRFIFQFPVYMFFTRATYTAKIIKVIGFCNGAMFQ